MNTDKPVLDVTCGSRMIWFDHDNDLALFVDRREVDNQLIWTSKDGKQSRYLTIKPDVIADFTDLPFEDETFWHVVFDPPHLTQAGDTSWLAAKYGNLDKNTWRETLHDGFAECWRVLKRHGTLIFKWNEMNITTKEVIDAIGHEPMYGCVSGKYNKTHWMAYYKH